MGTKGTPNRLQHPTRIREYSMKTFVCYYGGRRDVVKAKSREEARGKMTVKHSIPGTSDRNPLLIMLAYDEKGEPTIPGWRPKVEGF